MEKQVSVFNTILWASGTILYLAIFCLNVCCIMEDPFATTSFIHLVVAALSIPAIFASLNLLEGAVLKR